MATEMKTTLVVDVAASSGGALTILNMYYKKALEDMNNQYVFVISTPELADRDNVKVIRMPWVKKTWLHRIHFDKRTINKLIEENQPDEILSLQNIYSGKSDIYQTIYIHQSLPFTKHKLKIYKNPKLWVYQNIIGKLIKNSIVKADKVIVQTEWMKKECAKYSTIDKIEVEKPIVNKYDDFKCNNESDKVEGLFYPATPNIYKNHMVLLEALRIIKQKQGINIKLSLTLSKGQNRITNKIWKYSKKHELNVVFLGSLNLEQMISYYCRNILVFPSYIESYGMPLIEARKLERPIIALNRPFSREILSNYNKALFFEDNDIEKLSDNILNIMKNYQIIY
ncbi:MAG: glycosyltransferase [Candidatus Cloacimonetes bacterium]|nr:glycosyltransferase [Candidatus Cloacimonadota bacterium]